MKRIRFLLSPNLSDGYHLTVIDSANDVLDAVKRWMDEAPDGEHCEIKAVYMTQKEFDKIPEL